jgi:hypothetical protein
MPPRTLTTPTTPGGTRYGDDVAKAKAEADKEVRGGMQKFLD